MISTHTPQQSRAVRYGSRGPRHLLRRGRLRPAAGAQLAAHIDRPQGHDRAAGPRLTRAALRCRPPP